MPNPAPNQAPAYTVFIPGHPRPQGSKKHIGGGRHIEASPYHQEWRTNCIAHMQAARPRGMEPITDPIICNVVFVMPRPKRLTNPYPYRGDLDKLKRSIGDSLTHARIIGDDSRIVAQADAKRYAAEGEQPGAHVTIHLAPMPQ